MLCHTMALQMGGWIDELVVQDFNAIYAKVNGTYRPGQSIVNGRFTCGPEGAHVHCTEERIVQVIEVI